MKAAASSTPDSWNGLGLDLAYQWAQAKINMQKRPPVPIAPPVPAPSPGVSSGRNPLASQAAASDIAAKLSDIGRSPITWVMLAGLVGLFIYLRKR